MKKIVSTFDKRRKTFRVDAYSLVCGYGLLLDAAEFRAHLRLLFFAWCDSRHPCSLETEDDVLARLAGVSRHVWKRIKPKALTRFELVNGRWLNAGLLEQFRRLADPPAPKKSNRKNLRASIRFAVMHRDGFRCVYCGRCAKDGVSLEVDHVRPVAAGGTNDPANLATSCFDCNIGKWDSPVLVTEPEGVQ